MRVAYYDKGWLNLPDAPTDAPYVGIALGYDRCAEHEWGIETLMTEFGLNIPEFPYGIEDRRITRLPEELVFAEFTVQPKDKRRKSYPAALLGYEARGWDTSPQKSPAALLKHHGISFWPDPGAKQWEERYDLETAWSKDGFLVAARGDANIRRLRALHEAFKRLDIAIAVPWSNSFFRGGLSFAILSQVPKEERDTIMARDIAHTQLYTAAAATGVEDRLKAAGKRWHAFKPGWVDSRKLEVQFYLNPADRESNFGWFTVAELDQWLEDEGPVPLRKELKAFGEHRNNYDWACRLLKGLGEQGIRLATSADLVWFDAARTVPGLSVRVYYEDKEKLASGIYAFNDFMKRYAAPLLEAQPA